MDKEIEELANTLQGFVIEDGDLLKGKVFKVISAQRCSTIAETLIKEYGYVKAPKNELQPDVNENQWIFFRSLLGSLWLQAHRRKDISFMKDDVQRYLSKFQDTFGSSGKRPLSDEGIEQKNKAINKAIDDLKILTGEDFHGYRSEIWTVLCDVYYTGSARFSTAEVRISEERIEEIIMESTLADACVLEAYAGDVRELAKAIKAELENGR